MKGTCPFGFSTLLSWHACLYKVLSLTNCVESIDAASLLRIDVGAPLESVCFDFDVVVVVCIVTSSWFFSWHPPSVRPLEILVSFASMCYCGWHLEKLSPWNTANISLRNPETYCPRCQNRKNQTEAKTAQSTVAASRPVTIGAKTRARTKATVEQQHVPRTTRSMRRNQQTHYQAHNALADLATSTETISSQPRATLLSVMSLQSKQQS